MPPYSKWGALVALLACGLLNFQKVEEVAEPEQQEPLDDGSVFIQTHTKVDMAVQDSTASSFQVFPKLASWHACLKSYATMGSEARSQLAEDCSGLQLLQIDLRSSLHPVHVVYVYLAICLIVVAVICYNVARTYGNKNLECPEEEAWNSGIFNWLWVGWATQWIVVWGNAGNNAKIRAEEMPVSFPEDDCAICYRSIQRIWNEEVQKNGLEQAHLLRTLMRFLSYRTVLVLGLWNALFDVFLFLGPPLAVEWIVTYFRTLYDSQLMGKIITDQEKVLPTLKIIAIFTGLPITMITCCTVSTMLGSRMAIRISGGLSCLLFAKGQRLPVTPAHDDESESSAARILETIEKENGGPSGYSPSRSGQKAITRKPSTGGDAAQSETVKPKKFSFVQLVTTDVNVNVMVIPLCIIKCVVMVPVLACLMVLLFRRLGGAIIFTLGTACVNVAILAPVGCKMKGALAQFYKTAGDRLQFFQQTMAAIRFIKSSGGELAVQRRLEAARAVELKWLQGYYNYLCLMLITITQFPKLYLLASLGGFCVLHGSIEPTLVWSLAALLMSVQGAISMVFNIIPTLVGAMPSMSRLEGFLKLPEAPRASSLCSTEQRGDDEPSWVSIWPSQQEGGAGPSLRLKGSYSFSPNELPVLKDLDIVVPHGSSVAIVGQMGAGKSALLTAILGELYPQSAGAEIAVPRRIAYAAQTPHLFEGTLKENVLQGERFDQTRYTEALHAACLQADLRLLPGGDEAPVGSRGISLSGGQKSRISLARAVYCMGADLVLLDDPLSAADACTAEHLEQHLLHGPVLAGRTRVVVCQPVEERLARFDLVVVISDGRVVARGAPQDVVRTEEYRRLLSTQQETWDALAHAQLSDESAGALQGKGVSLDGCGPELEDHQGVFQLREEEFEGRASWSTLSYFYRMAGHWGVVGCLGLYFVKHCFDMAAHTTLARWTTQTSTHELGRRMAPSIGAYMGTYVFWVVLSASAHVVSWFCGQGSQLRCSKECHAGIVRSLLRAPTDGFFDRNPVGRIMNRMASDMMSMDQKVFLGLSSACGVVIAVAVDLCYVHIMMPLWFTLISIPVYYLLISLVRLYWRTMVPLRYLCSVTRSTVGDQICNVEINNASMRAYGKGNLTLTLFQDALRKQISADFVGRTILMRWLCNRLFLLGGFFVTCITILVVWVPTALDVGRASLCVVLLFNLIGMIESYVTIGVSAQYQIIAMNRLYEYTSLPEEREEELPSDNKYMNYVVRVKRVDLGWLHCKDERGVLHIVLTDPTGSEMPLLQQLPGKAAFVGVPGRTLQDLAPECAGLRSIEPWHRLAGVGAMHRTAKGIADELCAGSSQEVTLYIESGWLADGVKVEMQKLRTGYAGVTKDILRCIDLTVPRHCRLAIVGRTGCGKSTMLLSLLRVLEPRSGRICLEGVDTRTVGLRALRAAIGMVPQEPVLLQGPLRYNIDPLGLYDDVRIWDALSVVHLADHVRALEGGLDFRIKEEGLNLSFGQRQLLNLARNVLRKPMLLLMDEATSALDPHSQELLQNTMDQAFPDSTMMVVAHRLETILDYDMVVVMHEGRIIEQGSVVELSRMSDGILAKMLRSANLL